MITNVPIIVAVLYLTAGFLLVGRLARGAEATTKSKYLPISLGLIAAALHSFVLYDAIFTDTGLNLAFFNVLSLVMDLVAVLLLISAIYRPVENLGIALLPMAGIAGLLHWGLGGDTEHAAYLEPGVQTHILFSVVAYSLLSIAAVQAILLAVQNRHLRNRHPGGFIRALPPLETMESLLFRMIGIGYLLLSASLITGFLFVEDLFTQHLVHKTVLSLVAWGVFTGLLWGRWHFGWRGRTAIRWTLGGFITLMVAYFGSKLVLEFIVGTG